MEIGRVKRHCLICGGAFYGREIARYCSSKCRKRAERSKSQMLDQLNSPSVTYCIEVPHVYRFVIHNCDFCLRSFGVPPCPAPYANIYEMTYHELTNNNEHKAFLNALENGCNYFLKKVESEQEKNDPTPSSNTPSYFFDEYNQILYLFLTRNQLDWLSKIDERGNLELENELEIKSKKNIIFIREGQREGLLGQ